MSNKQLWLLSIVYILVIFGSPFFINLLCGFTTPITNGNDVAWLGFFGSYLGGIIGGSLTLIGVLLTFKKQDANRFIETYFLKRAILEEYKEEVRELIKLIKEVRMTGSDENMKYTSVGVSRDALVIINNIKKQVGGTLALHFDAFARKFKLVSERFSNMEPKEFLKANIEEKTQKGLESLESFIVSHIELLDQQYSKLEKDKIRL